MGTTMLEKVTNSDPNKCFKTVSAAKCKNVAADNKRKAKEDAKLKRKRRKRSDNSLRSRLDYSRRDGKGPDATEVPIDICTSNLHDLMVSYYEANIKIEEPEAQKITINTTDQGTGESGSQIWLEERRKRITSSNTGQIAKRKHNTKVNSIIRTLLYTRFKGNRATDWGLLQEDVSKSKYLEIKKINSVDFSVSKSGLVISLKHPWLAASPDGLAYDPNFDPPQGLVEFKNPYANRDKTVEEAASSKSFCLQLNKEGKLCLPKNHNYYFQVQCAMYCTNRQWCDFVVMTKNLRVERITSDVEFERKIIPKMKNFYFTAVLPDLASPQAE